MFCIFISFLKFCHQIAGVGDEDHGISLVNFNLSSVLSLDEFVTNQQSQAELALSQLLALREICVEIVWESCAVRHFRCTT